jgi:hypothetical protein
LLLLWLRRVCLCVCRDENAFPPPFCARGGGVDAWQRGSVSSRGAEKKKCDARFPPQNNGRTRGSTRRAREREKLLVRQLL